MCTHIHPTELYNKTSQQPGDIHDIRQLYLHLMNRDPFIRTASMTQEDISSFLFKGCQLATARCGYNGRIIAMASLVHVSSIILRESHGWIQDIVTDPEHCRQGLARELLQKLMIYARQHRDEYKYLDLTCSPERVGANAMYESMGFIRMGTATSYDISDTRRGTHYYRLYLH
ncbi:MAG: GNAT family N-acetyltransferase [Minisyncoccota bacterium]